jgi:drug/metabolite transporter (DMT)-like permease
VSRPRFTGLDALLVLVILTWGANLSVIKVALREFPAQSFNALRLILAAAAFLAYVARLAPGTRGIARADWGRVVLLGVIGGTLYQLLFLAGVPRTSVANSGLIFGLSPVVISLLSAAVGHERLGWTRWAGGALSVVGLYFVVGVGATLSVNSLSGDALVFAGMLCWAVYSVGSRPLLGRYSPTVLTAWTTTIGTALYLIAAVPALAATNWPGVSWLSWFLMAASSLLCLVLAYVIWYTGVQRLGATRTANYSNLTPIAAMIIGWLWLGEPITAAQSIGTVAILGGVFLTRWSPVVVTPLRDA